jgi:hypothetical protein
VPTPRALFGSETSQEPINAEPADSRCLSGGDMARPHKPIGPASGHAIYCHGPFAHRKSCTSRERYAALFLPISSRIIRKEATK